VRKRKALLAWELGQGLGHAATLAVLGEALARRGLDVVCALADPAAATAARMKGLRIVKAPQWPPVAQAYRARELRAPASQNLGQVLARTGFHDPAVIASMLRGWDAVLEQERPDLVVADFAPGLILAARGRIRSAAIGEGYSMPPRDCDSFPQFHPVRGPFLVPEERLLENVNRALAETGRPAEASWFGSLLADRTLMEGFRNSLLIGTLVVCLAVPLGLAAAIVMTQIHARARSLYYLVVVSPVLTPGVILGISTVIFWSDVTRWTGAQGLYNGIFLATIGQSTFISAYCMLIFMSRLQRFDRTQEEAALDLGATRTQVFFHVLLPFLKPAILSAAVLAFLSSFENYNTTTFAILAEKTLTTALAGRVRQGTTPAISALAVLIIGITLAGALIYELLRRREQARDEARARAAAEAERAEA